MDRHRAAASGEDRHRNKKLIALARWRYGGIRDERGELIGGAAFCLKCRKETNGLSEEFHSKFPDTCFFLKGKPEQRGPRFCARPGPDCDPGNADAVELFHASHAAIEYAGMDGTPTGHRMADVEAIARALAIPWDAETLMKFQMIEWAWLEDAAAERQKEAERRKREAERG